ncbi:MAG TPA: cell division protein FtsQ/DivIB [Thiobacillaceae bacterium]|nr:cell division protein FtsQ/DivIB [Thiobacillaceae bacterium]
MTPPELASHPLNQVARVLTWGALGLLGYGAISWLAGQSWFALRAVEVKTPVAHVTEAQIRLVAERQALGTFFTVDLDAVRDSFEKLPWVREARVERRWPDTLVVSLAEYVPLARWNDDALVSDTGEVFAAAAAARLPRLSGPEESSDEVIAAYRRYEAALAPLGMRISELRLSPRRAWRIRLDNGLQVVLGREHTDARLARFVELYPRLFGTRPADAEAAATPTVPALVDLRYPDGFAVRMPGGASPFEPSET